MGIDLSSNSQVRNTSVVAAVPLVFVWDDYDGFAHVLADCSLYPALTHEFMEMLKKSSLLTSLDNFGWGAILSWSC